MARILRPLLVICISLVAFPVRYYPVTAGLDPSWAFAVNYAHAKGRASQSGARVSARVPPEVLVNGIALDFVPWNLQEMRALFADDVVTTQVDTLTLTGPGARSFSDPVQVEIYEVPDLTIGNRTSR